MGISRRAHSDKFKAKVAMEAARGDRTMAELSREFGLHSNQISAWRSILLERAPELFAKGPVDGKRSDADLIARLYQEIGELKVQLDWLKKKSGFID